MRLARAWGFARVRPRDEASAATTEGQLAFESVPAWAGERAGGSEPRWAPSTAPCLGAETAAALGCLKARAMALVLDQG